MAPCDGNCFECQRPARQCHGGPAGKTAYTHSSQRPTMNGSGRVEGIKHALNRGRKIGNKGV